MFSVMKINEFLLNVDYDKPFRLHDYQLCEKYMSQRFFGFNIHAVMPTWLTNDILTLVIVLPKKCFSDLYERILLLEYTKKKELYEL